MPIYKATRTIVESVYVEAGSLENAMDFERIRPEA